MERWQREHPRRLTELNNLRTTARALAEALQSVEEMIRLGEWEELYDSIPQSLLDTPAVRALLEDEYRDTK